MNTLPHILLVEDEENFGAVLRNYLELQKFKVDWVVNGKLGYSQFRQNNYDLCLLDVMMPEKDGFELACEIKDIRPETPVIFLTARGDKSDQINGFKIGADDYITKPFDTELLIYKIRAILNRRPQEQVETDTWEIGTYRFERKSRMLIQGEERRRLTPKEAHLLVMLCMYMNDVLPRQKALIDIWKNDDYFAKRSMDVYMAKLRKYLNPDPRISLETMHGEGVSLRVDPSIGAS